MSEEIFDANKVAEEFAERAFNKSPLGLLHQQEALTVWLRSAARAYGSTLSSDSVVGTVGWNPNLSHQERIAHIERSFAPFPYDDTKSFEDQIAGLVYARQYQLELRRGVEESIRLKQLVRETLLKILLCWRSEDGAANLYLLLRLALRLGILEAPSIARDYLVRGRLLGFSASWRKSLGLGLSVLGREYASTSDGASLLADLHDRKDYWSPSMAGDVISGLVTAGRGQWLWLSLRHMDDFIQLNPHAQRAQYGQVADAAGLEDFVVDLFSCVPAVFGWKAEAEPMPSESRFKLINAMLGPKTSPIRVDREAIETQLVRGGRHVELRNAAVEDVVVGEFRSRAPEEELDVIDGEFSTEKCTLVVDDLRPSQHTLQNDPFWELDGLQQPEENFISETDMYGLNGFDQEAGP